MEAERINFAALDEQDDAAPGLLPSRPYGGLVASKRMPVAESFRAGEVARTSARRGPACPPSSLVAPRTSALFKETM
ncbi:hypothetical protein [Sphingomonas sp. OTU376]|uniref:hypothetical protein n=1 Tax=Sphingomonas sp. OTU376 TaxID=3043863 RepID=UPI00313E5E87